MPTYHERYTLNIALHGTHWAKVELAADTALQAGLKANAIVRRFTDSPEYTFELTGWTPSYGHPIPLLPLSTPA
jgi:hypothetical protein